MKISGWNKALDPRGNPKLIVCLLLSIVTLAVYWQIKRFDFISLDDNVYVFENDYVKQGLTKASVRWSFNLEEKNKTYWHPLTWLAHMLDVEIFGMNSGWHHMTNLLLHIANCVLLFVVLNLMTGSIWSSALVAFVFAVHPINVESVAWVAERKNVLSTLFWMLTILAYVYYVRHPLLLQYLAVCFVYSLGLLSKPMLVMLPFVLLLLDYWPFGRFAKSKEKSAQHNSRFDYEIFFEKIPLLLLAGITIFLSSISLQGMGNSISFESISLKLRIANAVVAYVKYLLIMFWPHKMAFFYPYPKNVPMWQFIGATTVLVAISVIVFWNLKKRPYLAVGWLWYLGTLIPVSGLVQAGLWPSMADRWAYVPLIGIFIMLAWGLPDLIANWRLKKLSLIFGSIFVIIVLMKLAMSQARYWENNFTLYEHALEVTSENYVAHNNLGAALAEKNDFALAMEHYSEAIRIKPGGAKAFHNMAVLLEKQKRIPEAIEYCAKALARNPDDIYALNMLGNRFIVQGKYREAIQYFTYALSLDPNDPEVHNNLGVALMLLSEPERAVEHFRKALAIKPEYTDANTNLKKAAEKVKMR